VGSTLPLRIISYNIRCDSASTKRAAPAKVISRLNSQFLTGFVRSKYGYTTLQMKHLGANAEREQAGV
jgi:hypothetical protein